MQRGKSARNPSRPRPAIDAASREKSDEKQERRGDAAAVKRLRGLPVLHRTRVTAESSTRLRSGLRCTALDSQASRPPAPAKSRSGRPLRGHPDRSSRPLWRSKLACSDRPENRSCSSGGAGRRRRPGPQRLDNRSRASARQSSAALERRRRDSHESREKHKPNLSDTNKINECDRISQVYSFGITLRDSVS